MYGYLDATGRMAIRPQYENALSFGDGLAAVWIEDTWGYINKKGLPCFKLDGKIVVKRSEFDRWMTRFRKNSKRDLGQLVDETVAQLKKRPNEKKITTPNAHQTRF